MLLVKAFLWPVPSPAGYAKEKKKKSATCAVGAMRCAVSSQLLIYYYYSNIAGSYGKLESIKNTFFYLWLPFLNLFIESNQVS